MIRVSRLSKSFLVPRGRLEVLRGVSFEVASGEIISLVGSNGSGKSTLMRLVAGLLTPDSGAVEVRADDGGPALVSLTHQSYRESLFPWRTARDNIRLAFETRFDGDLDEAQVHRAIDEVMESLGIAHLEKQRPVSMSGGQAQLVAVARALAHPRTGVLLMDEPFSALDGRNLERASREVVEISRRNGASTVVITHDLDLGILLGDRIAVLTSEAKGVAAIIDAPTKAGFDPDFLVNERFLACKKEVLAALYPKGGTA